MLTQLSIQGYRGIQDGLFTELGPINIVVGPNNCGKSTFLEALSLVLGPGRIDPLGRKVSFVVAGRLIEAHRRRGEPVLLRIPQTWWFRLDESKDISFEAQTEDLDSIKVFLKAKPQPDGMDVSQLPSGSVGKRLGNALFLDLDLVRDAKVEQNVWLELFKKRLDKQLVESLKKIYDLPVENMSMSTSGELLVGLPDVGLPIDSLGAGARVSLRLLIGALVTGGSMLLLEEIDAFQSPTSLARLAQILLEMCRKNDVQLFVTTHRNQTIRAFLDAGQAASLDVRVLPLVAGKDGLVRARGISAKDAVALADSGADLRELYRSMRAE